VCVAPCWVFTTAFQSNLLLKVSHDLIQVRARYKCWLTVITLSRKPDKQSLILCTYIKATADYSNVVDSSRPWFMYQMTYVLYTHTTAWLNGNSRATVWCYHLPDAPNTYTITLFLFPTTGFCDLQDTGWCTQKAESVQGVYMPIVYRNLNKNLIF